MKNSKQNKRENRRGIRHGEVILVPTDDQAQGKKAKRHIVAHSETGHHHVIESKRDMIVDDDKWLIELFEDSAIVHKKTFDQHKTLPLEKGTYKKYEAVEYSPFEKLTRRVVD